MSLATAGLPPAANRYERVSMVHQAAENRRPELEQLAGRWRSALPIVLARPTRHRASSSEACPQSRGWTTELLGLDATDLVTPRLMSSRRSTPWPCNSEEVNLKRSKLVTAQLLGKCGPRGTPLRRLRAT